MINQPPNLCVPNRPTNLVGVGGGEGILLLSQPSSLSIRPLLTTAESHTLAAFLAPSARGPATSRVGLKIDEGQLARQEGHVRRWSSVGGGESLWTLAPRPRGSLTQHHGIVTWVWTAPAGSQCVLMKEQDCWYERADLPKHWGRHLASLSLSFPRSKVKGLY